MLQESKVVLVEEADVVNPVLHHCRPFDAEAECKPGIFFGIISHRLKDIGVNHPGAPDFHPAAPFAHGASLSIVLPAWMKHMKPRISDRISQFGTHLFDDPDIDLTISRLENYFSIMGSPVRCQEIGLDESHKEEIAALMNKNKSNGKNPDNFLEDEDRIRIVENMFAE